MKKFSNYLVIPFPPERCTSCHHEMIYTYPDGALGKMIYT